MILRALRLERVVCWVCGMDNLHRRSRPLALDARCWGCSAYLHRLPDLVVTIAPRLDEFNAAMARLAAAFAAAGQEAARSLAAFGKAWADAMAEAKMREGADS